MPKMKVGVHDISEREAMSVFGEFSPNLPHALGVQFGALNGFQQGLIEGLKSRGGDPQKVHPVRYDVELKMLGITCPLLEGMQPALTISAEVKYHQEYSYPPAYDDWICKVANRFVAVFAPRNDGKFLVMYSLSDPDDLDQEEEVVMTSYDYGPELNNAIGSFHGVVADIVKFLIDGKPD